MLPPNIAAARAFVALVTVGAPPSLARLARSLDELALTYYDTPAGMPDEDAPDPPRSPVTYAQLGTRFPDLGLYPIADPAGEPPGEVLVGDAIDDLLDITRDLQEVLWRFDTVGAEDAHWYFRLLFEAHFGRHLRKLGVFLHVRRFD